MDIYIPYDASPAEKELAWQRAIKTGPNRRKNNDDVVTAYDQATPIPKKKGLIGMLIDAILDEPRFVARKKTPDRFE